MYNQNTRRGFTQQNGNVVTCPPCGESTLKGGKGVVKGNTLMDNPPSALRATSPAGGEVNDGFTLIELLVVVLIIGILAAVAVPQYQKTIERSKATEAMSMLSSIAKAYQTHYLANGQWATKFEQLDVDIPFTGNTEFIPVSQHSRSGDTKSNKDWSFQIEISDLGYITLFAARINGKYKGAGFYINFDNASHNAIEKLRCFERKTQAAILFDTDLPEGAYCQRVMQAKYLSSDKYARYYRLP